MIQYRPPKSQIWGHHTRRVSAAAIVERCTRFLESHCSVINSQPSELTIGWNDGPHGRVVGELIGEVDQTLGQPVVVNETPFETGRVFRQRRYPFPADRLVTVTSWLDRLANAMKTQEVVAHASTFWTFVWKDELPLKSPSSESAGGTFGVHLGRRHRITTRFSFRDLTQYEKIKAALRELELVDLSDKHLRPRVGVSRPADTREDPQG